MQLKNDFALWEYLYTARGSAVSQLEPSTECRLSSSREPQGFKSLRNEIVPLQVKPYNGTMAEREGFAPWAARTVDSKNQLLSSRR